MPAFSKSDTLKTAEANCFSYLSQATDSTPSTNCFIGRMPEAAYNVWVFSIYGDDGPTDGEINFDTKGGCGDWINRAKVEGVYVSRDHCQQLASMLRANLPTTESQLENIYRFYLGAYTIEEDVVLNGGHNIPVWRLNYELMVHIK